MSYTMLQLVQQVTNELGVSTPTYVATNTNQDVIQILALMNASGYELLRKHPWQAMTKQKQFYTEYLTTTGNWTTASRKRPRSRSRSATRTSSTPTFAVRIRPSSAVVAAMAWADRPLSDPSYENKTGPAGKPAGLFFGFATPI